MSRRSISLKTPTIGPIPNGPSLSNFVLRKSDKRACVTNVKIIRMKWVNMIFFGPPGAGKGTQAKIVSSKTGLPHIDTGSLIREAIKNQTELGKKAKEFVESGKLVPDDLVIGLIKEAIVGTRHDTPSQGFILDGYPRTIPQADALKKMLTELQLEPPKVINVQAPESILIQRLSSRRLCSKKSCGEIYNLISKKTKVEGKCDKCNSDLYQRKDDTEEACKERLEEYHKKTAPLENYYKQQGLLFDVDGTKDPNDIYKEITQLIS